MNVILLKWAGFHLTVAQCSKALWEKAIAADNNNLIQLVTRSLLTQGEGKTILVDTGLGNKLSEKMKRHISFGFVFSSVKIVF